MGPNLFARNENIAHVMTRGTTCGMMSPYVYVAHQELLMDVPFMQAE